MSIDALTLSSLAPRSYWVAWQTQDRPDAQGVNKPTKVPFNPNKAGAEARANEASTWGTRAAAEQCAQALPKPYGIGGVGLELAPLGDGRSLAGIDLDTCRDKETGKLECWAEDVIADYDTYTEISPSETGVKTFFSYDTAALPRLRTFMGTAAYSKIYQRGAGEHPPAIELHLGNRYFAVTDEALPNASLDLRHVDASTILRLIQDTGPAFKKATQGGSGSGKRDIFGRDASRSVAAFKIGMRAVQNGATFEQMCDALRADPSTADWMREKGEPSNFREARRIFDKAQATGPVIRIVGGDLHRTASAGEAAIIMDGRPIYQRGNALVRPVVQEVPAARGQMTVSAALNEITATGLVDALCGCAIWERFDARAEDWVRINPPKQVAEIILSRAGLWTFPKIVGVVTCPTLRPDGSILSAPGYDPATRLYHAADTTLRLTDAVHRPTKAAADDALTDLSRLLSEFPFVNETSRSVALSGLITPVVRGALTVAPLHAFRANTAGTGKSYLVDTASAISTGRPCPVAAAAADEAETEKRIAGLLLGGFPIASLDNVNGELGGDLLCQAIERPLIRIRRLGASDIVEIESRATLFATGNALRVRGDMTRRTVVADLDAGLERPELRLFQSDPVAAVMANRSRYVSGCLVIVRAYITAGCPDALPPLGSFADWSTLVRSALVWLGCADPANSMEAAREDDPELAELREFMVAWQSSLPIAEGYTVKELVDEAEKRTKTIIGEPTEHAHPEWRDCLVQLFGERGIINTRRLGRWLLNKEGRIVDEHRLRRAGMSHGGVSRWSLQYARHR